MEVEQSYRDQLTVLAGELKTHRDDSGIANDVYEYVDDLRSLAELMLETKPSRMNFDIPAHANTIERWAAKLRAHYGAEIDAQTDYRRAFEVGAAFLAVAKARPTPPDGYLGSDRIVRETFALLTVGLRDASSGGSWHGMGIRLKRNRGPPRPPDKIVFLL